VGNVNRRSGPGEEATVAHGVLVSGTGRASEGWDALLHPGEPVRWSGAGDPWTQESPLGGERNYRAISVS